MIVVRAKRRDGASSPTLQRFVLQEVVHVVITSALTQPRLTSADEQPLVITETSFVVILLTTQNLQSSCIAIAPGSTTLVEFPESSSSFGGLKPAPQSLFSASSHT